MTKNTAAVLNDFFSNIITNIDNPHYIEGQPVGQNMYDLC